MVTEVSPDADLLLRYVRTGDELAFAELVRRHLCLVYGVALRKTNGDRPMTEEVAQRVFTLLARKAATLTNHPALAGWLHQTTCFTTADTLRAERRRVAREQEAFAMGQIDWEKTNSDWSAVAPFIDDALAGLDEVDREAVLLRYFEELPHAQVGARLALSENAARMRVERALDKLHAMLAKRGITSTAVALGAVLATQAGAATVPANLAGIISTNALTGACAVTAAAGAKTGLITFMTTTKGAAWAAGAVAIFSVGLSGYTAGQRRDADTQMQVEIDLARGLERETASLKTQLAKTTDDARKAALAAKSAAPVGSAAAASPGVFEAETARLRAVVEARQKQLASNPDYQRRWIKANAGSANLEYQPFYRATGLSAEQISRFEDILTKWAWEADDLRGASRTMQLGADDPVIVAERVRQDAGKAAELSALLTPDQLAALTEFDHTATTRGLVKQVAAGTYYLPTPLTADQGARLQQLLDANDPNLTGAGPNWRLDGIDWTAVLKQSEPVLGPDQRKVLEAVAARAEWVGEQVRIANQWERK